MSGIYARSINQYDFKYHALFSASFYQINEEDQKINENELFLNLNFKKNLTKTDIENIDIQCQLEHQI